jgi:hypothetical protein
MYLYTRLTDVQIVSVYCDFVLPLETWSQYFMKHSDQESGDECLDMQVQCFTIRHLSVTEYICSWILYV